MKFDNIKNVPCVGDKPVTPDPEDPNVIVDPVDDVLEDCVPGDGDMEFAAIAGTSYCPNAPTIKELKIDPAEGMEIYELTGEAKYTAHLYFEYTDSTVLYRKDVTKDTTWKSSDLSVAVHAGGGAFTGKEVSADKSIKVRASYTPSAMVDGVRKSYNETFTASADLKVKQSCIDTAIDIVLVVDRSGSMLKTDEPGETAGKTRLEAAKEACLQLVKSSKCYSKDDLVTIEGDPNSALNTNRTVGDDGKLREVDRIAIVTYAGIGRGDPAAEVHSPFNSTKTGVKDSIGSIRVAYECGSEDTPSGLLHSKDAENTPEGCWTGMGEGLSLAYDLLKGKVYGSEGADYLPGTRSTSNSDDWPRKLIILLTDGYENVCEPDPETIATSIKNDRKGQGGATKAHDTMLYCIGFMVDSTQAIRRCPSSGGTTMTAESYMGLLANCYSNSSTSLTAFPQSAGDLTSVYTKLLGVLCADNIKGNSGSDVACHYIDNTGMSRVGGSAVKGLSVGYAFEQWDNWVVCKNTVDKMGVEEFNSINPSAGKMVGLIGNQGSRLLSNDSQQLYKEDVKPDVWTGKECQISYAPYDHNFGGIESREPIEFTKGKKYKLTLNLGGNLLATEGQFTHGLDVGSSVRITIGGTQSGIGEESKAINIPWEETGASLATINGFPALVTRNILSPLRGGASSDYTVTREDSGLEFVVKVHPEKAIASYDFEFTPSETKKCVIRVEQYPHKYNEAVKNFTHKLTAKDVNSVLSSAERASGERPKCSLEKELNISWFSGYKSSVGNVFYDSNEEYRYETSCADEFLGPVPFGVVLSNVILTEDGTSVFTDNFAT